MWLHSKAFVGNMTQSQRAPSAASNSPESISLQHTHRKEITDFSAMAPTHQGGFTPSVAVNLEAPLSFFTGYHSMIMHPKKHLHGYCIYSVLVLLPDRYGFQTLSYSLSLCTFQKNTKLGKNISPDYSSKDQLMV